jgi:hypothetical protein
MSPTTMSGISLHDRLSDETLLTEQDSSPPPTLPAPAGLCNLCEQPVPFDEVMVPEAMDYLMFLSGLICYDRWRRAARSGFEASLERWP